VSKGTGNNPQSDAEERDLAEFVSEHRKDLERRARQAGISADDAPDVVQDALLAASSQLSRGIFRRASSLATWVYTILGGKILDYRKAGHHRFFSRALPLDLQPELPAPDATSTSTTHSRTPAFAVRDTLLMLPPKERFVLSLKYFEEFTVPEIAVQLRWSERQVERVLALAREHFRQNFLREAKSTLNRLIDEGGRDNIE